MEEYLLLNLKPLSGLDWFFHALGLHFAVVLPLLGVLAFVLAGIAIRKFKAPALTAILVVVVPLPLYYGAVGMVDGIISSMMVISNTDSVIRSTDLAEGGAMSLVSLQVGLILSLPAYILAVIALIYRALIHDEAPRATKSNEPPIGAILTHQA